MRTPAIWLFALGVCHWILPAQAPPAPPARPPAATPAEDPAQELLATLRALRLARQEARRREEAFAQERQVLVQEIAALEARLESLAAEQARLAAEQGQAAGEAARAEEGAAGDRKLLEETAAVLEQARARFRALEPSAPPAPAAPRDPTRLAEAVGGFFRSLEIQAGRLREVGAAETEIPRQGGALPVLLLRLGEAVRLWRGLDGKEAGWLDASGQPHPLPPALADLGAGVGKAVEMLRRRRGPALITLPIPVAAGEEKR